MVLLPPFLGPGFRLGGIIWCARFECGSCAQFAVDEKDLMIEWLHALKVCGAALSTKKLDGAPTTELLYEKATKPGKKTVDLVASCTAMTQKYEAQLEEVTFPKSRDLPHLFWSGLCVIGGGAAQERRVQRQRDEEHYSELELLDIDEAAQQLEVAEAFLDEAVKSGKQKKIKAAEKEAKDLRKRLKELRGKGPPDPDAKEEDSTGKQGPGKKKGKKGKDAKQAK